MKKVMVRTGLALLLVATFSTSASASTTGTVDPNGCFKAYYCYEVW
ncbi:hypothetical protein [Cytobacillus kochii]|nr:hypothetical protein [Cytobacillus kochii]MDM5205337.1 hypothetical protein [Cytobacillus kochii]